MQVDQMHWLGCASFSKYSSPLSSQYSWSICSWSIFSTNLCRSIVISTNLSAATSEWNLQARNEVKVLFSERVIALSHAATANHCSVIIFAAFKWFRRKKKLPYFRLRMKLRKYQKNVRWREIWMKRGNKKIRPPQTQKIFPAFIFGKKKNFFLFKTTTSLKFCSLFASELKAQVLVCPYPCARLY